MDDMTNRKTKWITIKYDDGELIPVNLDEGIEYYKRIWGIPSYWTMPDDLRRNVEMLMYDQIQGSRVVDGIGGGQGRGAYDWNAHIDLANSTVQLPLVGIDDIDKNARFVLDKQGLRLADDDDTESWTWSELKDMIKINIIHWAEISITYSMGGIADSIRLGGYAPSKISDSNQITDGQPDGNASNDEDNDDSTVTDSTSIVDSK